MLPCDPTESEVSYNLDELTELARDGFPGQTLGDLLQLIDDLTPHCRILVFDPKQISSGFTLLQVVCQALSNAVVLAGRIASRDQLESLSNSLHSFQSILNEIAEVESLPANYRSTLMEYICHAERRIEVTENCLKRVCEESDTETSKFFDDSYAFSGSNEQRSHSRTPK
jgi:hypothetical protein